MKGKPKKIFVIGSFVVFGIWLFIILALGFTNLMPYLEQRKLSSQETVYSDPYPSEQQLQQYVAACEDIDHTSDISPFVTEGATTFFFSWVMEPDYQEREGAYKNAICQAYLQKGSPIDSREAYEIAQIFVNHGTEFVGISAIYTICFSPLLIISSIVLFRFFKYRRENKLNQREQTVSGEPAEE